MKSLLGFLICLKLGILYLLVAMMDLDPLNCEEKLESYVDDLTIKMHLTLQPT